MLRTILIFSLFWISASLPSQAGSVLPLNPDQIADEAAPAEVRLDAAAPAAQPAAHIPQPSAEEPVPVPEGASGLRIYIDPQTGAILKEPAPGAVPLQLTPQLQNTLSTSHQGLVEVPNSV